MSNRDLEVGVRLTADGKSLVGEARSGSAALNQLGETAKRTNNESAAAAQRFTDNLKRQADTIGMTASQMRGYDAAQMDLNKSQRASVEASNKAISAYETQQQAMNGLRNIAIAAGAAVGVTLVAGLKASVTLAAEAEQSHLRLAAVLRGTGHAAGLTKADLDGMAEGMKEKLGIDDDALRDSMAVLLTFRNVSKDSFGQALELSADLAAVMQTDLKSAVLQLGKALENPDEGLTALKRSGISFNETQKDMIKGLVDAGNQAEAMTLIMQTMKEQGLDGVAESMNQGITKATRDAGLAWDDLLKSIGNTSAVKGLAEGFFSGIAGSLKDLRQAVESGDWLDRLTLFATGIKTPSLIAKINAPAPADDPQARAIANEGLARQKEAQAAEIAAIAKKKADEEAAKAAEEASKRAIAAARAREEAEKRAYQQSIEGSNRVIAALKLETEQIGLNVVQKKMMSAAAEAAKAPTQELAQEIMASAQAWAMATQQQEAMMAAEKERLSAIDAIEKAEKEAAKASEASARESTQRWNNLWGGVEQTAKTSFIQFAAHGKSAMQSIGESIKLSIIDVLYQLTIRPFIVQIGASLQGSLLSGALGSATGSAAGGAGLLSNIGSGAGIVSMFKGGLSGISSGISGMMSGGGMGALALPLLGGFALNSMSNAFAGNKTLGNGFTDTMQKIPVLGAGWDIVAGLFGHGPRKFRQEVAIGDVSAEGFDGRFTRVDRAKGGLLVGNKHWEYDSPDSAAFQQVFDTAIKGYASSVKDFAKNLGLSADAVTGYSKTIRLESEKGKALTEEQINSFLRGIGNEFAQGIMPTVDTLKKAGEDAMAALGRLSNEFVTLTDSASLLLGKSVADSRSLVSGMSFQDRTAFIDSSGGAESLTQFTNFFADNFLTAEERLAPAQERLNEQLTKLGLSTDLTRGQFKDLVQSLGEVGGVSDDTWQSLKELAPEFVIVRNAQDQLAEPARVHAALLQEESRQYAQLVSQQKAGLESRLLQLQGDTAGLRRLELSALEPANRALQERIYKLQDEQSVAQDAAQKSAQITQEKTGLETQLLQLQGNTTELRSRELAALDPANRALQEHIFALQDEQVAAQNSAKITQEKAGLENQLLQLQGNTGELRKRQLDGLDVSNRGILQKIFDIQDAQASNQKSQAATEARRNEATSRYNALVGVFDKQIQGVTESIGKLTGLSESLKSTLNTIQPMSRDQAKSQILGAINAARMGGDLPDASSIKNALDALSANPSGFSGSYEYAREQARAAALISQLSDLTDGRIATSNRTIADLEAQRSLVSVPAFATGGFHRGGLRLVGERGPEIEATGPSRITSNNDLAKMLSNDDVVEQLLLLFKEMRENTKFNQRVANKLDAVTMSEDGVQKLRTGT